MHARNTRLNRSPQNYGQPGFQRGEAFSNHGSNIQVLSYPDGFRCRVSDVRPGREHDTTCAKKADGLLPALKLYEAEYQTPTLNDLGCIGLSPAIRHPHRSPRAPN